ncbi:LacI family DNA-binding transcriptional regulator [Devosia sp. MC521]|uniref:LacI family DNA-binding transcriptional regulator n=1 Tax=Devosia sp. MC521 TaxID=2759954 RepID=UPI0015F91FD6|nr:LacI family DNA-binding transcriptional regulator [Devosia sp. MC521]MBJ6986169.1 LacI family DNA-binding transcriptional regulator [Devosia sp. MC521]QMW64344.1 LacI family DNA-binding transcriptional regulator [Devosia sp. MC521]
MAAHKRLTQKDIAQLAGVSQATVSLVLNGSPSDARRIPDDTRERVLKVIRDTGYVADPVARRMVNGLNRILGVFTYEPAFPSDQADFFLPFLLGIEDAAQELGYDLLLLTGAGKKRKIFGDNVRLRLADGCIVLGRQFDRDELARLVGGDFPFVAVGRRDDAGGPVPYVGSDYAEATAELVARTKRMGHQKLGFIGFKEGAESSADRWTGFQQEMAGAELAFTHHHVGSDANALLDGLLAAGVTCVFCTELVDAIGLEAAARARGVLVPNALSIVVLGNHIRTEEPGRKFTSFAIPREAMGRGATQMLVRRLEQNEDVQQQLLTCQMLEGDTLGPVSR